MEREEKGLVSIKFEMLFCVVFSIGNLQAIYSTLTQLIPCSIEYMRTYVPTPEGLKDNPILGLRVKWMEEQ